MRKSRVSNMPLWMCENGTWWLSQSWNPLWVCYNLLLPFWHHVKASCDNALHVWVPIVGKVACHAQDKGTSKVKDHVIQGEWCYIWV